MVDDLKEPYQKGGPRVEERGFVRLVTGEKFYTSEPFFTGSRDNLVLAIATGLARQPRYAGQYQRVPGYFVAQHAIIMSYLVDPFWALEALHHDDPEALGLPDVVFDWKREMRKVEADRGTAVSTMSRGKENLRSSFDICSDRVHKFLSEVFWLKFPNPIELKKWDDYMHECEVHRIFTDPHMPEGHESPDPKLIEPISDTDELIVMFLRRHNELYKQRFFGAPIRPGVKNYDRW